MDHDCPSSRRNHATHDTNKQNHLRAPRSPTCRYVVCTLYTPIQSQNCHYPKRVHLCPCAPCITSSYVLSSNRRQADEVTVRPIKMRFVLDFRCFYFPPSFFSSSLISILIHLLHSNSFHFNPPSSPSHIMTGMSPNRHRKPLSILVLISNLTSLWGTQLF